MLELHASELVIDPLNDDFSSLIELLSAGLLSSLAALLDKLHELLFLEFPRELTLRIHLVVLFLPVGFLVSLKDMLDYLISGTACSLITSHSSRLELLLLLYLFSTSSSHYSNARLIPLIFIAYVLCGFVLFQYLRVQKFERYQRIIHKGL